MSNSTACDGTEGGGLIRTKVTPVCRMCPEKDKRTAELEAELAMYKDYIRQSGEEAALEQHREWFRLHADKGEPGQ